MSTNESYKSQLMFEIEFNHRPKFENFFMAKDYTVKYTR